MLALLLTAGAALPSWADDAEDCSSASLLKTDTARVVSACRRLADQGNASAEYILGGLYETGQGVPQDYATAMSWYGKAANQGNALGQIGLGLMYERGRGVLQNYIQAAAWYLKAADQGNGLAQFLLGNMYEKGQGVPQDYVQAYMWLNLSAAGSPNSSSYGYIASTGARDEVAGKMTPDQIAQAQALAAAWKPTTGQ